MIRGLEIGEIIPFPVSKTGFELLSKSGKYILKEVFFIWGPEIGEIIPFPVCKTGFGVLNKDGKSFVKEFFWSEVWK